MGYSPWSYKESDIPAQLTLLLLLLRINSTMRYIIPIFRAKSKRIKHLVVVKIWDNWNSHTLLVGIKFEERFAISYQFENTLSIQSSSFIPRYLLERWLLIHSTIQMYLKDLLRERGQTQKGYILYNFICTDATKTNLNSSNRRHMTSLSICDWKEHMATLRMMDILCFDWKNG